MFHSFGSLVCQPQGLGSHKVRLSCLFISLLPPALVSVIPLKDLGLCLPLLCYGSFYLTLKKNYGSILECQVGGIRVSKQVM